MHSRLLPLVTSWIVLALAGTGLVGCGSFSLFPSGAPPVEGVLGFRLIIDTGRCVVTGRVRAPAYLLPKSAPQPVPADGRKVLSADDVPVEGALVDVVDLHGNVKEDVKPVSSDASGHFKLRDLRIGEAVFVRARFYGPDGEFRYQFGYMRPEGETGCTQVNLASSLLAAKLSRDEAILPLYSSEKLAAAVRLLSKKKLPLDRLKKVVDAITKSPAPASIGDDAKAAADELIDQDPDIKAILDDAVDTYLEVTFTIQSIGQNSAVFAGQESKEHVIVGHSELICRIPDSNLEFERVTYYFGNDQIAAADFKDGEWVARVDTRQKPDGPYLLLAVVEPKNARGKKIVAKAYIFIKNTLPDESVTFCDQEN